MAQWLRALTVLSGDLSSVPTTDVQLTTLYNSSVRESDVFFWPPWVLYAQTCTQGHTNTHKINIF